MGEVINIDTTGRDKDKFLKALAGMTEIQIKQNADFVELYLKNCMSEKDFNKGMFFTFPPDLKPIENDGATDTKRSIINKFGIKPKQINSMEAGKDLNTDFLIQF
jgi:hypothetical protein